jgi:hypothetical protein
MPAEQRSNKMSARQRIGGSAPAPAQAYDTLLLALLPRVTMSDWHLFQTFAAVAHMTRSSEILRSERTNREDVHTVQWLFWRRICQVSYLSGAVFVRCDVRSLTGAPRFLLL